ncbi:MAG TPA: response regulator transcription factor, partial [Planctomycetes bacterium]|nr:response regulator transcription factor [Planctomycetota bacterium]
MRDEAPHILVVDDEPGMAEGCRRVLEAEGYRVETA